MDSENKDLTEQDPLTYRIIGEAMHVHTELGPGLDEVCGHLRSSPNLRGT
jgi:hypothetical protein